MMQFTIYDKKTGEISKVLTQAKEPKLDTSEGMIVGNYPDDKFYVVDGVPTPLVAVKALSPQSVEGGVLRVPTLEDETRFIRNQMLAKSDWTQLADSPVDKSVKGEWVVYRQALRDVTSQAEFPADVIWPTPPV
jgi:hypothetical protein